MEIIGLEVNILMENPYKTVTKLIEGTPKFIHIRKIEMNPRKSRYLFSGNFNF